MFCLVVALPVLLTRPAGATTYYVSSSDPNASDSYATSPAAAPWKTIAKINATTISPGDTVYFKCGDIWRESLVIKSGTQTGATTTYTSYGTGAKPIISGADVITGWTASTGGTANTYQVPLATRTYMVTSDNTFVAPGSSATTLAANQYYWSSGILYLNIGGDPSTHLIEAGQRNNPISGVSSGTAPKTFYYHNTFNGLRLEKSNSSCINVGACKYWTIENCEMFFSNSASGAGAGVNANNCAYMTVTGCHVNYALGDGVIIYNSTNATVTNNLIENVLDGGVNSGGDCIQLGGSTGPNCADNFQILNNTCIRPNVSVEKGCIIALSGDNGVIQGNSCTAGKFGISVGGNNDTVCYNYVTGTGIYGGIRCSIDYDLSGVQIFENVIVDSAAPFSSGSAGITITDDTRQLQGYPTGDGSANRSNFTICNNVFYNTYYGIIAERGGFSGAVENNIGWNDGGVTPYYRLNLTSTPISGQTTVIDHNIWSNPSGLPFVRYYNGTGTATYATLAAWQATGFDAHSSVSDPLWANAAGNDFHLQVGSPAIDTGVDVGLTTDYYGDPIPQGPAPDLGVSEYQYAGSYAYEGFNYTSATVLSGLNGGTGWAAAWSTSGGVGNAKTTGGSLTYTGLPTTGNMLRQYGSATGTVTSSRTLSRTFGAVQEVYWISFLAKKLYAGLEDHIAFGGLDFEAIGGTAWQVKTPSTSYTTTGASETATHLFLVRVDAGASSDAVHVWIDPAISAGEPPLSSAVVTLTDTSGMTFNSVKLSQGVNGDSSKATEYDEFRLGGSFNSVVTGP